MADPIQQPTFPSLLQRFFTEYLGRQRAVSPRTVTAYRDTFRLLLGFAEATIGKPPTTLTLADLDAKLILGFLDHLEKVRNNTVRSRNARLAALRCFLKFAAHHDITALAVIEQALAVPMKKFDRPMLGFLTRPEIQAILDAPDLLSWAGQRDGALFSLLYNTGARVSEANLSGGEHAQRQDSRDAFPEVRSGYASRSVLVSRRSSALSSKMALALGHAAIRMTVNGRSQIEMP